MNDEEQVDTLQDKKNAYILDIFEELQSLNAAATVKRKITEERLWDYVTSLLNPLEVTQQDVHAFLSNLRQQRGRV